MKKVLLVRSEFLLSSAVEFLLSQQEDLALIVLSHEDIAGLVEEVGRLKPDTVIIDQSACNGTLPLLFDILRKAPEMRFFVLHLEKNCLQVYKKQEVSITGTTDLVEAIKGNHL